MSGDPHRKVIRHLREVDDLREDRDALLEALKLATKFECLLCTVRNGEHDTACIVGHALARPR